MAKDNGKKKSSANIYGPTLKTSRAEEFTMKIFKLSRAEKLAGRKGNPVCAWGPAGIGKTELPNMLVKKYPDFFGGDSKKGIPGNIVYLPMAQIEEKAELQGLPELQKVKRLLKEGEVPNESQAVVEEIVNGETVKYLIDNRTVYATPSWIPQVETHGEFGILVIDDFNRADGRIINSVMQLLQDGKLLGWELPKGWEIYLTANPDDGVYDVTPLDDAQMTRMSNFYQEFDKNSWLENWAIPTGIHPIAQNFVMTYPEMVTKGERTNPRSFDKLFRQIYHILDKVKVTGDRMELGASGEGGRLAKEINDYGKMNVETDSLQSFISFLTSGYGKLPDMEEILSKEFDLAKFYEKISDGKKQPRVDILTALNTRLTIYVRDNVSEIKQDKDQIKAIQAWLKAPNLPADLKYDLTGKVVEHIMEVADAEIAQQLFGRFNV